MGVALDRDMEWAIAETDRTWTEYRDHLKTRTIANSFGGHDVDTPDRDRTERLREAHRAARERLENLLSSPVPASR